jgi:hypothetical protein
MSSSAGVEGESFKSVQGADGFSHSHPIQDG